MIVFLAAPAFAQDGGETPEADRRMAVTVSLAPLVVGAMFGGFGMDAGFEYAFAPFASVKANVRFVNIDPLRFNAVDADYGFRPRASQLRYNLEGRWYPQENYVQGFFLNGNLQYQRLFATSSIEVNDEEMDASINTLSGFVGVGYKAVFRSTRRHAFVMEPALDLGWRIFCDGDLVPPLGQLLGTGGVRFRVLFGAAF